MLTYPNNTGLNFIDSYDKSIINDMQKITQQGFLQKAKCDTSTMLCNYYRVLYVITILRNFKQTTKHWEYNLWNRFKWNNYKGK